MGKEITVIVMSMPSIFNMKKGSIGNNSRAAGGKLGLSQAPWKVLLGKLETIQTAKRKTRIQRNILKSCYKETASGQTHQYVTDQNTLKKDGVKT